MQDIDLRDDNPLTPEEKEAVMEELRREGLGSLVRSEQDFFTDELAPDDPVRDLREGLWNDLVRLTRFDPRDLWSRYMALKAQVWRVLWLHAELSPRDLDPMRPANEITDVFETIRYVRHMLLDFVFESPGDYRLASVVKEPKKLITPAMRISPPQGFAVDIVAELERLEKAAQTITEDMQNLGGVRGERVREKIKALLESVPELVPYVRILMNHRYLFDAKSNVWSIVSRLARLGQLVMVGGLTRLEKEQLAEVERELGPQISDKVKYTTLERLWKTTMEDPYVSRERGHVEKAVRWLEEEKSDAVLKRRRRYPRGYPLNERRQVDMMLLLQRLATTLTDLQAYVGSIPVESGKGEAPLHRDHVMFGEVPPPTAYLTTQPLFSHLMVPPYDPFVEGAPKTKDIESERERSQYPHVINNWKMSTWSGYGGSYTAGRTTYDPIESLVLVSYSHQNLGPKAVVDAFGRVLSEMQAELHATLYAMHVFSLYEDATFDGAKLGSKIYVKRTRRTPAGEALVDESIDPMPGIETVYVGPGGKHYKLDTFIESKMRFVVLQKGGSEKAKALVNDWFRDTLDELLMVGMDREHRNARAREAAKAWGLPEEHLHLLRALSYTPTPIVGGGESAVRRRGAGRVHPA